MKHIFLLTTGVIGSLIASLFGGWTIALETLFIFMLVDYLTGLIVAGVFHKSSKTKNGALESRAGFKGLCRKVGILLCVLVAYRFDLLMDTTYLKDAICITFVVNESISILENIGLMGVPIPDKLTKAIEILKERGDKNDQNKTGLSV